MFIAVARPDDSKLQRSGMSRRVAPPGFQGGGEFLSYKQPAPTRAFQTASEIPKLKTENRQREVIIAAAVFRNIRRAKTFV